MVLALLEVATYDYHDHPDGPAMMALIIASMSVARDAFEIGHVRWLQQQGRPLVTLPDGKALWALVTGRADLWAVRVAVTTVAVGLVYLALTVMMPAATTDLGELIVIGVLAGAACTLAFVQGLHPSLRTWEGLMRYSWRELLRFFLWPGMAFGWTYYLIADGAISFLMAVSDPPVGERVLVAAGPAGERSGSPSHGGRLPSLRKRGQSACHLGGDQTAHVLRRVRAGLADLLSHHRGDGTADP